MTMTTATPTPATTTPPRGPSRARKRTSYTSQRLHLARRLSTTLIAIIVAVQVYPLAWLLLTSLRPAQEFASGNPFGMPSSLTLENYRRAFEMADLPRYIFNSLVVTGVSSVLIVTLGMMGAYAVQVLGFKGSKWVLGLFLLGIIVPVQVALVPLFINYSRVGLLNTYQSMILPLVGFALPVSV